MTGLRPGSRALTVTFMWYPLWCVLAGAAAPAQAPSPKVVVSAPEVRLGEEQGGSAEFRKVEAVLRDTRGNIYVLDSRRGQLLAYGADGHPLAETSRPGQGPGELGVARSLAIDEVGDLHVLDLSNLRISVFGPVDAAKRRQPFERGVRLPIFGASMCRLQATYYLFALQRDSILHVVDAEGTLVRSFGDAFGMPGIPRHPRLGVTLSKGFLLCDPVHDVVVVFALSVGEVRGYSSSGTLRWTTFVKPYVAADIHPTGPQSVEYRGRDGGWYQSLSLARLANDLLLVQAEFTDQEHARKHEVGRIVSYLLDARTGAQVATQDDLPRVAFADDSVVISVADDPFPQIAVRKYAIVRARP
jgi:hypothetical protein